MAGGPERAIRNQKGELGGEYITDTSAHTGEWDTILVHEDAVAAIVAPGIAGTLSAVVLPAGMIWCAPKITSITLASGKVTAYTKV